MTNIKQNYLTEVFNSSIMQVPGASANNQTPFAQYGDFLSDFIVEGLSVAVPSPASLTATLSTGTAVVLGQRTVVDNIPNATNTYAASSDTYVSLSQSGVVDYTAVANGGTVPAPASDAINILKVVTSPIQSPTPTLSAGTSGTLAAGTYQVALVAYDATGYGAVSASSSVTVAASGSIGISWTNPLNETSMSIYVTSEGGATLGLVESGVTGTSYTYTGSVAPGEAAPSVATSNAVQGSYPVLAKPEIEVNVISFGADPTGNTYSDAAFIAASATAIAQGSHGVLRIPAGNYSLSPEFTQIEITEPISIIGEGYSTILTTNGNAGNTIFNVTCGGAVVIKDFFVTGNNSLGRYVISSSNNSLNGFSFSDIHCTGMNGCVDLQITQNGGIVSNCSSTNGVNGFVVDAANCTVTDCYAINNSNIGFLFTSLTGDAGNIVCTDCTAFGNTNGNVALKGNTTYKLSFAILTGLTISYSANGHGILLDTYGWANMVSASYIELSGNNGGAPFLPYDGLHITENNSYTLVNGVEAEGSSRAGIYFDCNTITISACSLQKNAFEGGVGGTGLIGGVNATNNISISNVTSTGNVNSSYGMSFLASSYENTSVMGGDVGGGISFAYNVQNQINFVGVNGYSTNNLVNPLSTSLLLRNTTQESQNWLPNSSFLYGFAGWATPPSGMTLFSSAASIYAVYVGTDGSIQKLNSTNISEGWIVSNAQITLSGWVFNATAGGDATLSVECFNSSGSSLGSVATSSLSAGSDATFLSATGNILSGTSYVQVSLGFQGVSSGSNIYFSRLKLEVGSKATLWSDEASSNLFQNGQFSPQFNCVSSTDSSTLTGTTSGTITSSMPEQGVAKKFMAYANAYKNDTTTAQTITFPTAFTNTPVITTNTSGLSLTVSTTELTITAPDNTTTYSGLIIVEGF